MKYPILQIVNKYFFCFCFSMSILLCSTSCKSWWSSGDDSDGKLKKTSNDKIVLDEGQKNALQAINYINWFCALIDPGTFKNYHFNQVDLEFAYQSLTADELNLNSIPDRTTVVLIKEIEKYILRLRIKKEERDLLEEMYKREKRKALFSALPANMAVIVDANWKQILANVAQTLFYSYMNYRKIKENIEIQYQKDSWELNKDILRNIHEKNAALLEHQWSIMSAFKISDKKRIPENDAKRLLRNIHRANSDSNEIVHVYNILKNEESSYEYSPVYWYYRGCYAYSYDPAVDITKLSAKAKKRIDNRIKDAQECFKNYQKIAVNLFRKCPMSADVAMHLIQLEIISTSGRINENFIKEQLEIIEKNIVSEKDEDKYLFCGIIYLKLLKDPEKAAKCFQRAESDLRKGYKDSLLDFVKQLEDGGELKSLSDLTPVHIVSEKKNIPRLPGDDLLFFSRFCQYYSRIKASPADFVDEIQQLSKEPETSLLEILFYGANVETEENKRLYYTEIIPRVLGIQVPNAESPFLNFSVGENGFPYSINDSLTYHDKWWPSTDNFVFEYPLNLFSMQDVKYWIELQKEGKTINNSNFQNVKQTSVKLLKNNDIRRCKVSFGISYDAENILKSGATHICFIIQHKLFKFIIRHAIVDFQKGNGKFVDGKKVGGSMQFILNKSEIQKLKSSFILHTGENFFLEVFK